MLPVRIRRGRCALAVNAVVESEECESAAGAGMSMADDDDKAAVALARDFERSRGGDCGTETCMAAKTGDIESEAKAIS